MSLAPSRIAETLGPISYAEAEEFCTGVRRNLALALDEQPIKKIVTSELKLWEARAAQPELE